MGARKNASINEAAIECAVRLFAQNGVSGTSLGDIAKECDISKGTLYYYYPSKEMLVFACAEVCVRNFGDQVFVWMNSISPEASSDQVCSELVSIFLEKSEYIHLLLALLTCNFDSVRTLLTSAFEEWRVMLEVGALHMPQPFSERLIRFSTAVIPQLIGFAITNTSADCAVKMLSDMLR